MPEQAATRADFETRMRRVLVNASARQRRELVKAMGDPPQLANVPESLWLRIEREQEEEIASILMLLYIASFDNTQACIWI